LEESRGEQGGRIGSLGHWKVLQVIPGTMGAMEMIAKYLDKKNLKHSPGPAIYNFTFRLEAIKII
jgi:hypothetical protein